MQGGRGGQEPQAVADEGPKAPSDPAKGWFATKCSGVKLQACSEEHRLLPPSRHLYRQHCKRGRDDREKDCTRDRDDVRESLHGEDRLFRNYVNGLSGDICGNEDVDELPVHPMRGHGTTKGTKQT